MKTLMEKAARDIMRLSRDTLMMKKINTIAHALVAIAMVCMVATAQAGDITPNPNPSGHTIEVRGSDTFSKEIHFQNNGNINILNGGTLTTNYDLPLHAHPLTNYSGSTLNIFAGGTLVNEGSTYLESGATLTNNKGGTINNSLWLTALSGSTMNNYGTINNLGSHPSGGSSVGSIEIGGSFSFDSSDAGTAVFNNYGTINNSGYVSLAYLPMLFNSVLNNYGTLHNLAGGHILHEGTINNMGTVILDAGSYYEPLRAGWTPGIFNNNDGGTLVFNRDFALGASYAGTVNLNAGGTLQNNATLTNIAAHTQDNSGTIINNNIMTNAGTINNTGGITLASGSNYDFTGGTLNNNGGTLTLNRDFTFNGTDGGSVNLNAGGTVQNHAMLANVAGNTQDNYGTISNYSGATLTNDGTLNNYGTVDNQAGATLTNNNTLNNLGTLPTGGAVISTLTNAGTFTNNGTLNNIANGHNSQGIITNSGTFINTGVINNESTNEVGAVHIINSGTLTNEGALNNKYRGEITNTGIMTNTGTITNESAIYNTGGTMLNSIGATVNNIGWIETSGATGAFTNNSTLNNDTGALLTHHGATSTNNGTLNNTAVDEYNAGWVMVADGGSMINNGTLNSLAGSDIEIGYGSYVDGKYINGSTGGTFTNNGILNNAGLLTNNAAGHSLINSETGTLNNSGILYNAEGSIMENRGALTNSGDMYNKASSTLTNSGNINNIGKLINSSTINNAGTLTLASGSTYNFTGGTLKNNSSGTLELKRDFTFNSTDGGTVNLNAGGKVENYATLTNAAGHTQDNSGFINNNTGATFSNAGTFNNNSGATLTNSGTVTNNAGATLSNDGTLTNNGTLNNVHTAWLYNSGNLTNSAPATITNDGYIGTSSNGTITNNGTVSITANGGLFINDTGKLDNSGLVANDGWLGIGSNAALSNGGTLNNNTGGNLVNSGNLTNQSIINNAGTANLAGGSTYDFTGGTLNNNSGGTLVLNRDFTFNGTDGGTVNLNAGGKVQNYATLTNAAGHTQDNSGFINNNTGATFSNAGTFNNNTGATIANSGALTNSGRIDNTGTVTLNANSAYDFTGGTFNNNSGGTLELKRDFTFNGTDGGTVKLNAGGTVENYKILTNAAGYIQENSGGINNNIGGTFTNDGAIVNYPGAGINNSGTMTNATGAELHNGGALTNNTGATLTNSGTLTNYNSSTLTNAGTLDNNSLLNNISGATINNSGILNNNVGAIFVNNGTFNTSTTFTNNGLFMGTGTTVGNVVNNGTIAPGNSIGTMTITGNFTSNPGSVYQVEINPAGQSDRLNVSGTATLNGGKVSVLGGSGNYGMRTEYLILNALGGLTGTFGGVTSDLAFLTPSLDYRVGKEVWLTMARNSTSFCDVAGNSNQASLACVLDNTHTSPDMVNVINALLGLSADQARNAYDQMSGYIHIAMLEATNYSFSRYVNTLSGRMEGFGIGGTSFSNAGNVLLASRDDIGSDAGNLLVAAVNSVGSEGLNGNAKKVSPWGLWAKGYGNLGDRSGNEISSKYDYRGGGLVIGFDRKISERFLLGVSAGYSYTRVDMNELSENGNVSSYQGSVYGAYNGGPLYVHGLVGYGYNRYDTTRNISFGNISRTANGNYTGSSLSGYVEAGYRLPIDSVSLIPMASLQAGSLWRYNFIETDAGALNLDVENEYATSIIGSAGFKLKKEFKLQGGTLTPELRVRWLHEFANNDYSMSAVFASDPISTFTVNGDGAKRDSSVIGFGLAWDIGKTLGMTLSYDVNVSGDRTDHSGMIGMRYRW